MIQPDHQPTLVDLFCGAGGLSLGMQTAGFRPVYAADIWSAAVATHRLNLGEHVVEAGLDPEMDLPHADVYAGGPPCQGFSSAGRRVADDDRNTLVGVFAGLIAKHRPRAFVFENVEGFLTSGTGRFIVDLLDPLIDAGYCIHMKKVNAADFGVPQHRKRTVAIGGLGWDPGFPAPTHASFGAPGTGRRLSSLPLTPTVSAALAGLPPAASSKPGEPQDHVAAKLHGVDLQRAALLGPGDRMRDLPDALQHTSYQQRAHRRVSDGTASAKRGGAPAGIRRLRGDEPSKAITGAALRDFLHPSENRRLTIRECARLQTFPDPFVFTGSVADRIQQIGNSVPVGLAAAIGRHLRAGLAREPPRSEPGRLCSFVPSASSGMSPRLAQVTGMVASRYNPASTRGQGACLWQD